MKPLIQEYINKGATIIDVRTPDEFRGGHCEGSINIPLQILEARSAEIDKSKYIILCCASGGRSGMAMSLLKGHGYENVINAGAWTNARDACR